MIELVVDAEQAGTRLDRLVQERVPGISRAEAQRLVDEGRVTVDGLPRARSLRVQRGMAVRIEPAGPPRPRPRGPAPPDARRATRPARRAPRAWSARRACRR
ncbi:MAG: S4 domain-containing protein, partial [Actinomycetota bacterium]